MDVRELKAMKYEELKIYMDDYYRNQNYEECLKVLHELQQRPEYWDEQEMRGA